jgi:L-alanine-DL-glutamate epimerase-like enolase superfamily enzyme
MSDAAIIVAADAIQKFDPLELPIVEISDRSGQHGVGFGYTIGTGGTAMRALLQHELLPRLIGIDSRKMVQIIVEYIPQMEPLLKRPLTRRIRHTV